MVDLKPQPPPPMAAGREIGGHYSFGIGESSNHEGIAAVNTASSTPTPGESSKIKSFMGKTPGILKSKFLSVLGNSNEILNGISNKLDITLSLSSDSDDYCDDDEEEIPNDDESIDMTTIDFESRRVKERRAHEEIISGRFRYPIPKVSHIEHPLNVVPKNKSFDSDKNSKSSSTYSNTNSIDSRSPIKGESTDLEEELKQMSEMIESSSPPPEINICLTSVPEAELQNNLINSNVTQLKANENNFLDCENGGANCVNLIKPSNTCSSTLTSINDPNAIPSVSLESSDLKLYVRSESQNSVPSWASSISLEDDQQQLNQNQHEINEKNETKEFIKKFVEILFTNSSSISLDLKSEFGQKVRTEMGRLWFSRYVNTQRSKSKRVDETTFYSLVQYFAIVLFECAECEDYSPAKNLMNMCFTFYHDIDVPGCEPYREYLFTYLRQQPIWHTLRFWNAAFFDALQCERAHRPVPKTRKIKKSKTIEDTNNEITNNEDTNQYQNLENNETEQQNQNDQEDQSDISSDGSSFQEDIATANELKEDQKFQQNITFGQLGTFTCNMHAFGLSKDLCLEFLRKQSIIANLPKDQEKLLRDNINRMYLETEKWGA